MSDKVCFLPKSNGYGKFKFDKSGTVYGIRLTNRKDSIGVTCNSRYRYTPWGCDGKSWYTKDKVSVYITNKKNKEIYPVYQDGYDAGFYTLYGFTAYSNPLKFFSENKPGIKVKKGEEWHIWYGEDYKYGKHEANNSGKTCSVVDAFISPI